jgi:hypothetical protein
VSFTFPRPGATFAWALAAELGDLLAAVVAMAGTPHPGFTPAPAANATPSVLDIHGAFDTTCPANSTEPSDCGWYYQQVRRRPTGSPLAAGLYPPLAQ